MKINYASTPPRVALSVLSFIARIDSGTFVNLTLIRDRDGQACHAGRQSFKPTPY